MAFAWAERASHPRWHRDAHGAVGHGVQFEHCDHPALHGPVPLVGLDGNPELSFTVLEIATFDDAAVARISEDQACITIKPDCGAFNSWTLVAAFTTEWPRPATASLPRRLRLPKHHGLSLASACMRDPSAWACSSASGTRGLRPRQGGTGDNDERGSKDRAFPQLHCALTQHLVHTPEDLLGDAVLFQPMADVEDRGLNRDPAFH
jgi:hypothetical protein